MLHSFWNVEYYNVLSAHQKNMHIRNSGNWTPLVWHFAVQSVSNRKKLVDKDNSHWKISALIASIVTKNIYLSPLLLHKYKVACVAEDKKNMKLHLLSQIWGIEPLRSAATLELCLFSELAITYSHAGTHSSVGVIVRRTRELSEEKSFFTEGSKSIRVPMLNK